MHAGSRDLSVIAWDLQSLDPRVQLTGHKFQVNSGALPFKAGQRLPFAMNAVPVSGNCLPEEDTSSVYAIHCLECIAFMLA